MYLHTPALEAGSWWRVDTASGSDTATTVYAHDGTDAIPNYYVLTGSTVRNTTRDGTAQFWSATATLYCKELTYQGVPNGTVVTSTGTTPAAPVGGAPVDIATISTAVAALPTTYVKLLVTDATSATLTGTLAAGHLSPVDCTVGPGIRTLPAANSVAIGTPTVAKKADTTTNTLTVQRAGSDLIFGTGSGSTSKTLTLSGEAVTFVSNGVDRWSVESSDTPSSAIAAGYAPIAATPVASSATSGTLTAGAEHNLSPSSAAAWTLPTGVSATKLPTTVKNNGTAAVTVARGGSDTINGGTTSVSIAATEWARFTSDGAGAWTQSGTAGQSGTYAPQRAFMRYDPSTKSDGALGSTADTGQALTKFVQTSGNPAALSISSGVITHTPPGSGVNSAGYLQANLGARVRRIGAMISWPTSALGVATLVIPSAAWSDGSLPNAGFHLSINGNGVWTLIRYSGGGNTTLASYTTHGRFNHLLWGTGLQPFDVWLDPDNNRCVIVWPDGTTTSVTSTYFGSDTGNYALWELFENAGTDVAASFGAIWADTEPVNPDVPALTPYRLGVNRSMNAPGSASVSGSVTVDLSTTPIQVLTLTGNVTAFVFSNPQSQRQEIEVHFLQDSSGSRTLTAGTSTIKWAGGSAPTLTTTASRRDIFRFRYISGTYYEISRSMNVG